MIGLEAAAFLQVILIDIILAGDNAVVIGALAAGLPPAQRRRVIGGGIILAVALRIVLSLGIIWLLLIPGVTLIGSALLFWVAWKMWKDLRDGSLDGSSEEHRLRGFWSAIIAVAIADMSMSLDNVLGVAAAARGHALALVFGLLLSMAIMGLGANLVAALINKRPWIAYIGLALIVFIAARMGAEGLGLL